MTEALTTEALARYDLAISPKRTITISIDVNPSDVELALATNAASLRSATLVGLLAALVVHDAAEAESLADRKICRLSSRSLHRPRSGERANKRP
jgi:hypothetical protein